MSRDIPEKSKKKSRIGLIILLLIIIGAVVVIVLNPFRYMTQFSPDSVASQENTEKKPTVRTTTATIGTLRDYLRVNGDVVNRETLDIYPEATGKLTSFSLQVGDVVSADQEIARIDPSRPGTQYREVAIKSPVAGTVLQVNFSLGATVSPQAALVRIGLPDALEVQVAVPERYIGVIDIGTEAVAEFAAFPGTSFIGKVSHLSPVLHPATRTLTVSVSLDDPQGLIKAGMFPSLILYTEQVENVIIIDHNSVLYEGDKPYVFTVDENDQVHRRDVELGLIVDDQVEVVTGLSVGDEVVLQGQTLLTDGASVRVIE
jgi:multidrug efflux pump subunit AcrA (membrane-fusion protein)